MDHDEKYGEFWKDREDECLPSPENDVLSNGFSNAKYTKGMEEKTVFGTKNSITLPSLAKKFFSSLRDENDEPIYTYNEETMRYFVGQSAKNTLCTFTPFL